MAVAALTACQESVDERAAREAREYTEKYCPTPPQNDVVTDSMTFDTKTRAIVTYLTFSGLIDDAKAISEHSDEIRRGQLEAIRQNTTLTNYKEAGLTFVYVCRSQKKPGTELLRMTFTAKDYR